MSSKKSVLTIHRVRGESKRRDLVDVQFIPAGVELRILPNKTSPLNGRKTNMRNSTATS
jgi:hypothetical protein